MIEPAQIPLPDTAPDDRRCGHLIAAPSHSPAHVIIGFGSDAGVQRNGGRTGAATAPDLIRKALFKLTPDPTYFEQHKISLLNTLDAGNVVCTGRLEEDQEALGKEVARWLEKGVCPIILGGGHETAYGHFLGYVNAQQSVNIINMDAHPDVRPLKEGKAHSGSPFRQALEHPSHLCSSYAVYGLARWATAQSHLNYLENAQSTFMWDDEMGPETIQSVFAELASATMVSIDMDVVNASEAPGVSAPAQVGIPLKLVVQASYLAGKSESVRSLDLVEVNPGLDIDQRTVRAAALCIWQFLRGAAEKENGEQSRMP